jgi:uncharacterized membrane protein
MPWIVFGYPILAHLGVWLHDTRVQFAALVWLLIIGLWDALLKLRIWAWTLFVTGSAGLYALALHGGGIYILYLPPILIPLVLLWLFARSLLVGSIPLVTRFAEAMRGEPLPEVLKEYTRKVTVLWSVVSAVLTLSALVSAIWATPQMWSLLTNIIHYLVLGAVFLLEFMYRKMKYAALEPWSFMEFIRKLARIRLRV